MARYKLILAYDGTAFHGFQRQASQRTVQSEVEKALAGIGWRGASILAAGRTDTGVHALGQVVSFDLDWAHGDSDLANALNANLPGDIAAKNVSVVADDFHPRYDARARTYRYQIISEPQPDPLRERYAWRVWPQPEIESLQAAAELLTGGHDFAAFGAPMEDGGSTIREIFSAQWLQVGDQTTFEIAANAFLYHMVRHIVDLLVEIGLGKKPPQEVLQYLEPENNLRVQGLAPPHGLFLTEVRYK
jgi:tRNA pseudouridine38-40 synthase